MSDPHDPIGVAKPAGWFGWISGRAGRREYWLWVGMLFVAGFVLSNAPPAFNMAMSMVLMFVQIRRAHDLGRSGWWGVAATLGPVLPSIPIFYLANETIALAAGICLELILLAILGALRGDLGDNRFGPPPPFTMRRILTGR